MNAAETRQVAIEELLKRETPARGTTVTNCIVHMGQPIAERDTENCRLCRADVANSIRWAVTINEWLTDWRTDATRLLEEDGR